MRMRMVIITFEHTYTLLLVRRQVNVVRLHSMYSATREDDTTFLFSHFGLFLSDAASNSHK